MGAARRVGLISVDHVEHSGFSDQRKGEADMTHEQETNVLSEAVQLVLEEGLDGLGPAVSVLLNEAMKIERSRTLAAEPWERTPERRGYANGYKQRTLKTRLGKLELQVPQVRGEVGYYPSALERGQRSERALKLALAEMYVQGVSTRNVTEVLEVMCGTSVSSSEVSRASALMDEELGKWRQRPLAEVPYLVLDARYEKVRQDGAVASCAVLIASGVDAEGRRTVLGVSVSLSEGEVHWRDFLRGLKERGLHGMKMITSDDHHGLKAALRGTFSGVPWQRCQVHLQRNAAGYVPKVAMRGQVAQTIREIFTAPDREDAQRLLDKAVAKYQQSASKLAAWMAENLPEGFTAFSLPASLRRRLRSTNMVEWVNKEIRRRTRVAALFPNEQSLLRLVSAILVEISEDWETGKRYVSLDEE
jgi:transposase-like protein